MKTFRNSSTATMPGCLTVMVRRKRRGQIRHLRSNADCWTPASLKAGRKCTVHTNAQVSKLLPMPLPLIRLPTVILLRIFELTTSITAPTWPRVACRRYLARKQPHLRRVRVSPTSAQARENYRICDEQCYKIACQFQEEGSWLSQTSISIGILT